MVTHKEDLTKSRKEWVNNVANAYIDYLLKHSGDTGEQLAQEADELATMTRKREFADNLVVINFNKLPGKKFGVFVEKLVADMVADEFLGNYTEAEDVLLKFNNQYGKAADVPRTSFKAFLLKFNEIFIPLENKNKSATLYKDMEGITRVKVKFQPNKPNEIGIYAEKPVVGESFVETVYVIVEIVIFPFTPGFVLVGYSPHYEGAEKWIKENGKKGTEYVIKVLQNINV